MLEHGAMTDPATALEVVLAAMTAEQQTAAAAAIDVLTAMVQRQSRQLAGFRGRKISGAQRDLEIRLVGVKLAAFTAAGGSGSAYPWIVAQTRLPRTRVRGYLAEIRRHVRTDTEATTV